MHLWHLSFIKQSVNTSNATSDAAAVFPAVKDGVCWYWFHLNSNNSTVSYYSELIDTKQEFYVKDNI